MVLVLVLVLNFSDQWYWYRYWFRNFPLESIGIVSNQKSWYRTALGSWMSGDPGLQGRSTQQRRPGWVGALALMLLHSGPSGESCFALMSFWDSSSHTIRLGPSQGE